MVVALSYSSRWEILNATKKMVKEALESGSTYEQIEDKLTGTNLGIVLDRKARPRSVKFKFRWAMGLNRQDFSCCFGFEPGRFSGFA